MRKFHSYFKRTFLKTKIMLLTAILFCSVQAQNLYYYQRFDPLQGPPAAYQDGLVGHANPAVLGYLQEPETQIHWQNPPVSDKTNWGVFTAVPRLGFGAYRQYMAGKKLIHYNVSTGFESRGVSVGFSYVWNRGATRTFGVEDLGVSSVILRPNRFVSVGVLGAFGLESGKKEGIVELGVRPFGTPLLTLFGDALFKKNHNFGDTYWSAGAAINVGPGVNIVGRYFGDEHFTVGLSLDMGYGSVGAQQHFDIEQEQSHRTYHVRMGGLRKSFLQTKLAKDMAYAPFDLRGMVGYESGFLLGPQNIKFYDLLKDIQAAGNDPRISVLAFNMSGFAVMPEHGWELRQALLQARENGKKIIMFFDSIELRQYALASVADQIVMDPQGMLMLPGYLSNSTYINGALKKLGLNVESWRFYKYKSAFEMLSRDSMSEAEREQRQALVDAFYETDRQAITGARDLTEHGFDAIVDSLLLLTPREAKKAGLVDDFGRWIDKDDRIKKLSGKSTALKLERWMLWDNARVRQQWGPAPRIALVYGVGATMMDSGMNARKLEKKLHKLAEDNSIDAVVFRVDSPGGSAIAADRVAEGLRECAKNKPVVISQGQVAASGGYWVSMYGDRIFAGPTTVTGSIGVIGGWIWDDGLSDSLGMSHDYVKRGEHADFTAGISIPLLGRIPARNLSKDEFERFEHSIRNTYDEFVSKVAQGREVPRDHIEEVARGRVWSGRDGLEKKLVDEIGGLAAALEWAKTKAGIRKGAWVDIVEITPRENFFERFTTGTVRKKIDSDPVLRYIQIMAEAGYQPLHILPPDWIPTAE